jgi:hypothetical protein
MDSLQEVSKHSTYALAIGSPVAAAIGYAVDPIFGFLCAGIVLAVVSMWHLVRDRIIESHVFTSAAMTGAVAALALIAIDFHLPWVWITACATCLLVIPTAFWGAVYAQKQGAPQHSAVLTAAALLGVGAGIWLVLLLRKEIARLRHTRPHTHWFRHA